MSTCVISRYSRQQAGSGDGVKFRNVCQWRGHLGASWVQAQNSDQSQLAIHAPVKPIILIEVLRCKPVHKFSPGFLSSHYRRYTKAIKVVGISFYAVLCVRRHNKIKKILCERETPCPNYCVVKVQIHGEVCSPTCIDNFTLHCFKLMPCLHVK